jgi:hypothetical protein
MNRLLANAFIDELEKIAEARPAVYINPLVKEAFLGAAAKSIGAGVRSLGSGVKSVGSKKFWRGIGDNASRTAGGFLTPGKSLKEGLGAVKEEWKKPGLGGLANKALWVSSGIGDAQNVLAKEDPTGEGRTRAQRALGVAGSQAGMLMGYRRGMTGIMVGSMMGDTIGKGAGKLLPGQKPPAPAPGIPNMQSQAAPQSSLPAARLNRP